VPLSGNPKLTFRLTFCDVGRLTGTLYAICGPVLRPMAVIAHTGVRAFGQSPDENEAGGSPSGPMSSLLTVAQAASHFASMTRAVAVQKGDHTSHSPPAEAGALSPRHRMHERLVGIGKDAPPVRRGAPRRFPSP
jgi:hypothetical protein